MKQLKIYLNQFHLHIKTFLHYLLRQDRQVPLIPSEKPRGHS